MLSLSTYPLRKQWHSVRSLRWSQGIYMSHLSSQDPSCCQFPDNVNNTKGIVEHSGWSRNFTAFLSNKVSYFRKWLAIIWIEASQEKHDSVISCLDYILTLLPYSIKDSGIKIYINIYISIGYRIII